MLAKNKHIAFFSDDDVSGAKVLNEQIVSMQKKYAGLLNSIHSDMSASEFQRLTSEASDFDEVLVDIKSNAKSFINESMSEAQIKKFQNGIKIAKQELEKFFSENKKLSKNDELFAKYKELQNLDIQTPDGLRQFNQELALFKKEAVTAGASGKTFGETLKENITAFARWYLIGNTVATVFREFKEGVSFIYEMNEALTTINITMPATKSELRELGKQSIDMAHDLGTSASSVMDAAKIYANANESVSSVLAQARPTVMLSTASGMSTSQSADVIQGIKNQFDLLDGSESHIIDVLENVSKHMKVDFQKGILGMSEAIRNSGSVAKEAGFDLEEYSAIVGNLIEKTRQDGSTIGNATKMIFSRMGRATDGDISAEEVSKAEQAYKSIGIALRDVNGEFRKTPDVLDELSLKWDSLNSVQKTYIAEQSAGKSYAPLPRVA